MPKTFTRQPLLLALLLACALYLPDCRDLTRYGVIRYRGGYGSTDAVILDLAAFAQGDDYHADH